MAVTPLEAVQDRIAAAAVRSGRSVEDIQLVAVSKNRPASAIRAAHAAGQREFGENRQQGLAARLGEDLPADIMWHFIGPLQGRKASFVAEHAHLLHSFDRLDLVKRWAGSATPVLLQFNLGAEPQKGGFDPREADQVFAKVAGAGIVVKGVMAIPPQADDSEATRPWFARLKEIFDELTRNSSTIDTLSMGMSNDYEVAIEEGATLVRIGTAIFGPVN